MGYRELAVKIKNGYSSLKREPVFKCLDIIWNQKLKTAEISVVMMQDLKQLSLAVRKILLHQEDICICFTQMTARYYFLPSKK